VSKSASGAPNDGQILLYTGPNGKIRVDVAFRGETAWLTQKALAALFGVKVPAITKHLKNIFASGELVESAVVSVLETTAADGIPMKMRDSASFLNSFLELSNYPILEDAGSVSALQAKLKAEAEYEVYRLPQDAEYVSDFDKEIKRLEGDKP
jgi:hypothetical protein